MKVHYINIRKEYRSFLFQDIEKLARIILCILKINFLHKKLPVNHYFLLKYKIFKEHEY